MARTLEEQINIIPVQLNELIELKNDINRLKETIQTLEKAFAQSIVTYNGHIANLHVQRIG
jgi:prefoldin subunit 5